MSLQKKNGCEVGFVLCVISGVRVVGNVRCLDCSVTLGRIGRQCSRFVASQRKMNQLVVVVVALRGGGCPCLGGFFRVVMLSAPPLKWCFLASSFGGVGAFIPVLWVVVVLSSPHIVEWEKLLAPWLRRRGAASVLGVSWVPPWTRLRGRVGLSRKKSLPFWELTDVIIS